MKYAILCAATIAGILGASGSSYADIEKMPQPFPTPTNEADRDLTSYKYHFNCEKRGTTEGYYRLALMVMREGDLVALLGQLQDPTNFSPTFYSPTGETDRIVQGEFSTVFKTKDGKDVAIQTAMLNGRGWGSAEFMTVGVSNFITSCSDDAGD